jgi:hypothetical protein
MWWGLVGLAIGLWLMVAPVVLRYGGLAATNDRIVGPIVASVAFVALWDVVRPLRWLNLAPALWLVVAPWALGYQDTVAAANSVVAGLVALASILVRGPSRERFGGGWTAIWRVGRGRVR